MMKLKSSRKKARKRKVPRRIKRIKPTREAKIRERLIADCKRNKKNLQAVTTSISNSKSNNNRSKSKALKVMTMARKKSIQSPR
jgi:hypothetical protein